MTAKELYQSGKLQEAIKALSAELRDKPDDAKGRIFLFELLCFAGEFERAEKALAVLSESSPEAATGALLYRAALNAERERNELFTKKDFPPMPVDPPAISGTLNGQPFEEIEDSDPRIGPRLEVFGAGRYIWIPLAHIASIEIQPPKRLRDLLWAPAMVRTGPAFEGTELGEVLIPVLSPFSFRHADDAVRLGRSTVWEEKDGETLPYGQKTFLVDGEDIPLLELRRLEFNSGEAAPEQNAAAE